MQQNWIIRPRYVEMVKRFEDTKDLAKKIQMKYMFIEWLKGYHNMLTDAELEYLQKSICYVEDINF
jgi:hypothetical protein